MISHLTIALVTFMVTNIDDLLILSIYFSSPKYKTKSIVAGQYLGIAALIAISLIGLFIGKVVDQQWVSLLGLLPFFLGVKDLIALRSKKVTDETEDDGLDQSKRSSFQFLNVALVTIANGGDNIGVYVPLFANVKVQFIPLYIITWLLLTAMWCFLAFFVVKHPHVKKIFSRYGRLILPLFLMALGSFIMKDFIIWVFTR